MIKDLVAYGFRSELAGAVSLGLTPGRNHGGGKVKSVPFTSWHQEEERFWGPSRPSVAHP